MKNDQDSKQDMSDLVKKINQNRLSPRELSIQVEQDEAQTAKWLLLSILALLVVFVIWAFSSEMETLTRASGKVIPSSKVKVIQHFEGGIVQSILTHEGELVQEGQTLVIIDNTKAETEKDNVKTRLIYGMGKIVRLEALLKLADGENVKLNFPKNISQDIIYQETVAFNSARAEYEAYLQEFEKKLDQRKQRKTSIYQELELRRQQIDILNGTIETYKNLKGAKAISRLDLDAKENQLIETKLQVANLNAQLPILESEYKELIAQRSKYVESFKYETVQKLSEAKADADASSSNLRDREGALSRTEITSPITGVINQLFVNSPGEVIRPGGEIAEIVPVEDKFVAEVLVPPSEIGFLEVGQAARIKVTAYDSSRYGSLHGKVTNISSDTIVSKDMKNQEFYRVRAATDEVLKDANNKELEITAGMTVTVDIVTGKKTVAEFLLLPIMRGLSGSLRQK